jgi:hypothetical protein
MKTSTETRTIADGRRAGLRSGISLPEVLVTVVIAAMVLTAVLSIYSRIQQTAAGIIGNLDEMLLPSEILQLIAEDLDRSVDATQGLMITVEPKYERGYSLSKLVIRKEINTLKNRRPQKEVLEEIIWQGGVDLDTGRIVIYRRHSGMFMEDRLLGQQREEYEIRNPPFVPVCGGLTQFLVKARQGDTWVDRWQGTAPPTGLEITISFAAPHETPNGELEVLEEDKIIRTMAVDRTRKIRFETNAPDGSEKRND